MDEEPIVPNEDIEETGGDESHENEGGDDDETTGTVGSVLARLACLVFLLIGVTGIPIAMITIGGIYWNQCPIQNIPLLLIVGGCITFFQYPLEIFNCFYTILKALPVVGYGNHGSASSRNFIIFQNVFRVVSFCWSIAAGAKMYSIYYDASFDPASGDDYCHPVLFNFTFWLISLFLGWYGVMILAMCCLVVYSKLCGNFRL